LQSWSSYMTGSSQLELVKPKPKRRRKPVFSSRKQIRASRMRQQKQQYDSLNSTVKALEFSPDAHGQGLVQGEARRTGVKTLTGRKLEWVRPDKWSSQNHMIYREFARPRYEPRVNVNTYALDIRGCNRELSKHSPCKGRSQWKGTRLPQQ